MSWPLRSSPVRVAISRMGWGARPMLPGAHSPGRAAIAAIRAFGRSSMLNEDVTHDSRESQLHPRVGQDVRRVLRVPKMVPHGSRKAGPDGISTSLDAARRRDQI